MPQDDPDAFGAGSTPTPANAPGPLERLATLEAMMRNAATKTDISNLKVWVLGGVLSAIVAAGAVSFIVNALLPEAGPP